MNFFNFIRKGTNKSLVALQDSAIYEIAAEKLEPKPYAQLAKPLYFLSQYFSVAYHFISYTVALIGISIYALYLDSFLQKSIIILLSFLFLAIIEIAKNNSSNTVFSSVARKEEPNKLFLIILLVTTVFSFVTSVWSAKESIYYASTNSKFSNIDSLQNNQIDSVNQLYSTQIVGLQNVMKANQNVINTNKTNWKINIATDGLNKAQTNLNTVLEAKQKALLSIQNIKTSSYKSTSEKGIEFAIFAAVLFAILEILNLVCYWFIYQYYQSCVLENNLPAAEEEPTPTIPTHSLNPPVTNDPFITPSFTTPTYTTAPPLTYTPNNSRKIGFQFGSNNDPVITTTPTQASQTTYTSSFKVDTCEFSHCGKKYDRKAHNQRFCSKECRIRAWELEKGIKLNFSSKTSKK